MAGYVLLEGGAEFGGLMAEPDRRAIELAGGPTAPISIIPTAAAPDHNHQRAGNNGVRWFRSLAAQHIELLPLIDKTSADDSALAAILSRSRLIYLLGGFPRYLGETLKDSVCWQAMLDAYESGAVLAGSSAGAMVLCQYYYDPSKQQVVDGLGLIPNACILPHHNTFGKSWAAQLARLMPTAVLVGIDEHTGMIDDASENNQAHRKTIWRVYGQGAVTLYRQGQSTSYGREETFTDNFLPNPSL
jgi:cyanophycinase